MVDFAKKLEQDRNWVCTHGCTRASEYMCPGGSLMEDDICPCECHKARKKPLPAFRPVPPEPIVVEPPPDEPKYEFITGRAGCLVGETVLRYRRNTVKNLSLWHFFHKFNRLPVPRRQNGEWRAGPSWPNDTKTHLQSLFPDSTLRYNEVLAVLDSGIKDVIRLTFDDEVILRLTPDHPIALASGEFLAAADVPIGDLVLRRGSCAPLGTGGRKLDQRKPRVIINTKYHPGPEKWVNGCRYVRVARARLVVEAALNNLPYEVFVAIVKRDSERASTLSFLSQDVDVHHRDEDPMNDVLSNLEVLTHAEHGARHSQFGNLNHEFVRETRLVSIISDGKERTFDIQMAAPANNFCANDIIVHNSGKTTLVRGRVDDDPEYGIHTASTGVAAVNLGAVTIHSTFGFFDEDDLMFKSRSGKLHQKIQSKWQDGLLGRHVILDEISMFNANCLDLMFNALAKVTNGEVGFVLVGDFLQIPPVEGEFAFNAKCWPKFVETNLTKIHRQDDPKFLEALNTMRGGDKYAARLLAEAGAEFSFFLDPNFKGLTLMPTNKQADAINNSRYGELEGPEFVFERFVEGGDDWKEIPQRIFVKRGMRCMITANDNPDFAYANGDMGEVVFVDNKSTGKPTYVIVRLDRTGGDVEVYPITRRAPYKFGTGPRGSVTFMPVKVAYALTVHKCQGLTLDKIQFDVSNGFAGSPALAYVACSRVRRAADIKIVGAVDKLAARINCSSEVKKWI